SLSHKLAGGRNTIANGIQSIGPAIGVLASENSQISSLLSELSNLGVIGTRVAEQSGQSSVQDVQALLPLVEQLSAVQSQLGPDVKDLALFEADTPKVAPGDYLQVSAVVNVLLPSGGFEPGGPAPTSTAASTDGSPAGSASTNTSGSRAVSTILGAGLI
ncbi:MAG TPA: hypothetical protein VGS21_05705, partial [Acidimicrobiales bacterium]|nr:hypothetical protein [Acidimicrobiales bacterium]